jgi:signal transduction histidine kinase
MRERVRQFGGSLAVSRQEPGTLVGLNVPLPGGAS